MTARTGTTDETAAINPALLTALIIIASPTQKTYLSPKMRVKGLTVMRKHRGLNPLPPSIGPCVANSKTFIVKYAAKRVLGATNGARSSLTRSAFHCPLRCHIVKSAPLRWERITVASGISLQTTHPSKLYTTLARHGPHHPTAKSVTPFGYNTTSFGRVVGFEVGGPTYWEALL
jgi:hypothetical protein